MGILKRIPVRQRITVGLVGLMVGSLLMASALGFFPNEQREILRGRSKLSETLAITSTGMASSGQFATLRGTLESVVNRDADVLSIGLRTEQDGLLVAAGPHGESWISDYEDGVEQVSVPVYRKGEKWGHLEICFRGTGGILGLNYWAPAWLLIVLIPACFLQFSLFLRKTLKHLDPSDRVPQHVQDALNTLSVGLLLLDSSNRVIYANSEMARSIGRDADELHGIDASELKWVLPDGHHDEYLPWIAASVSNNAISDEILQMSVASRIRTYSVNCSKVGKGMMATFDDITLLEEAREAAQHASESKSVFLANMSHEIRTPLNAVLGFTDVLRRGLVTDTDESLDHLNMIHSSGKHLLELINDILDLSKIEAGKMDVESIDTQIDKIVLETVDALSVRARENDLDLNVEFQSSIPRTIQSDPTRLRQIITNMVGNAIKFTEQGSVTIATRTIDCDSPRLEIDIIDTGIGMTPDQQAKIFESFSQADETTTRRFGGTGLGLSISRQLSEALGGGLTVSSEPGVGSTFTVTIPLGQADLDDVLAPAEIQSARVQTGTGSGQGTIRLTSKPILVVDDGEANRRLIELVLTRAGGQVVVAENGLEAIKRLADQDFDLIYMDMQMPVMDGYTATRRIREVGLETPIVALTGNAMKGDRERCIQAGCDDFLTKPVDIDKLLETTVRYIGQVSSGQLEACVAIGEPAIEPAVHESRAGGSGDLSPDNQAPSVSGAIYSQLPMDDADFRSLVVDFVERLGPRLDGISAALVATDFVTVSSEAHWLKGVGGTVGFPDLTQRAKVLEQAAKSNDGDEAAKILQTINEIHSRIVLPNLTNHDTSDGEINAHVVTTSRTEPKSDDVAKIETSDGPPILCTLPLDDAEFYEIVCDFIDRLDVRLREMECLCEDGQFDQLAREAHWLKGTGGTVGYSEFAQPAAALEQAAKRGSAEDARSSLRGIVDVRRRINLPDREACA